jgi:hypothetical protein
MSDLFYNYDDKPALTVPLYKRVMCGNNWFGDLFYKVWGGLECICCAFWRGMFMGGAIGAVSGFIVGWLL